MVSPDGCIPPPIHGLILHSPFTGILPLDTIRTGECLGRTDGMCALSSFLTSQYEAEKLANYQFACFANYTITAPTNGNDYDGTVTNTTAGIVVSPGEITAAFFAS